MNAFPSLPPWDGVHPAVVHFPIALFLAAPLLLLVSLFARQSWKTWAGAALILMVVGTVAAWVAVSSGHAAGQLVDKTAILEREIARHEALGEQTRNLFTLLTVLMAALMLWPSVPRPRFPVGARITLSGVLLLACIAGSWLLAGAAGQGGKLVHDLGVRAMVQREATSGPRAEVVMPSAPREPEKAR